MCFLVLQGVICFGCFVLWLDDIFFYLILTFKSWIETNCTFVSQRNTSYQDEYSVIQFDVLGKYPYNDSYKNFTRSFISSKHYTVTYDAGEVLGCYYDAEQQYFYFDKGVELAFYWMIIVGSGATAILSALLAIGMYIGCVRCVSEQMVYFND
eukprot:TRINITY_DN3512_c1_g4_i2.p1 TRINITY_DN3512_c1_g4~~TRINITY_DN3512_c1_g4_i2.p1  ORF type:complete len:153 (+),score=19.38 TRINITY_DN3512_c1_g4_i2:462-920(+)